MSEEDIDLAGDPGAAPEEKTSLLAKIRLGALVLVAGLILFVVARNWDVVTIDLFTKEVKMPKSLLVIITFLAGAATGLLLAYLRPWRKKKD